jgi:hypothetical protein
VLLYERRSTRGDGMAHPFFDENRFPANRSEARDLHRMLTVAFSTSAAIQLIYNRMALGLPGLTLPATPEGLWDEVLRNLAARGLLEKLCNELLNAPDLSERNKGIVMAVVNAVPAAELPIIPEEHEPVLDRQALRAHLTAIEPDTTTHKVLLVRGDQQTGKSHSRHLFERVARLQGAEVVYLYAPAITTVQLAILRLFSALNASSEIPPAYTTDFAGYQVVCLRLQEIARREDRRLWIAVDDLGPGPDGVPLLADPIREFFETFGLFMLDPGFRQRFRLLLMHFPEYPTRTTVPTGWKGNFWRIDRTSGADVQREHVLAHMRDWLSHRGPIANVVEAQLEGLADDVIAAADAPGLPDDEDGEKSRLQRLNEELTAALERLAARSS